MITDYGTGKIIKLHNIPIGNLFMLLVFLSQFLLADAGHIFQAQVCIIFDHYCAGIDHDMLPSLFTGYIPWQHASQVAILQQTGIL